MPRNKMEDLRNHLFVTLEKLHDDDNPFDLDRAKTIAQVSKALIDSAKVEVSFLKLVGGDQSSFMDPKGKFLNNGDEDK